MGKRTEICSRVINSFACKISTIYHSVLTSSPFFSRAHSRIKPFLKNKLLDMYWTSVNREMFKSNAAHLLPCCRRFHQTQTLFQRELTLWQLLDARTSRSRLPAPATRPQSAPDWAGTTESKGGQHVLRIASHFTPSRVINVGERKENDPNRAMWSLGLQMNPLPAAAPRWFGRLARPLLTPVWQTQQYLLLLLLRCPWNWTTLSEFSVCVTGMMSTHRVVVKIQRRRVDWPQSLSLTWHWNMENS